MKDFTYGISSFLIFLGYGLFILGMSCNSWKCQSGYTFGLWYRCDRRGCVFHEVEFNDYLTIIRGGLILAGLFYSIGVLCLCLEMCMKLAKHKPVHRRRIRLVLDVATFIAEIIITLALAFYGYRTVSDKQRLPHLLWGFAVTGVAIMASFIGSILRTMGPVRTWDRFFCMRKSPKKTKKIPLKNMKTNQVVKHTKRDIPKGGKRYSKPVKKKEIIVYRKVNQPDRILPYLAPGIPHDDSYESLISSPQLSTKSINNKYEEISQNQEPIFFRPDHSMTSPRPFPIRRQENEYQFSVHRSPRSMGFRTLPAQPTNDHLSETVMVRPDSPLTFDRQPSHSMHSFVYDWP